MHSPRFLALALLAACGKDASGPNVSIVTITPASVTLGVGSSQLLSAQALDATLAPVTGASVRWSSSASSIVAVTNEGLVFGQAAGTATITASAGNASGTATVTVASGAATNAVVTMPGLSFTPAEVRIARGGSVAFQFPALPHNVIFKTTTAGAPADIQTTQNVVVSRAFGTAGTFDYDCTLHPGMSGRVIVSP